MLKPCQAVEKWVELKPEFCQEWVQCQANAVNGAQGLLEYCRMTTQNQ